MKLGYVKDGKFIVIKERRDQNNGLHSCEDIHGNHVTLNDAEILTFASYAREYLVDAPASEFRCPEGVSVGEWDGVMTLLCSERRAASAVPSTPNLEDQTQKADAGKPRDDLLPPMALHALACVAAVGPIQYPDPEHPWRSTIECQPMRLGRLYRAGVGHARQWWMGEDIDGPTGMYHLAQAAWNMLWALEFCIASRLANKVIDDRPNTLRRKEVKK